MAQSCLGPKRKAIMKNQLDHRQLADEMEIFFLNEQIGAGLPVWLPNGVALRDVLENFVKKRERDSGYQRVVSPHIGKASLYECSGHLQSFDGNMFPPMRWPEDNSLYYLKPITIIGITTPISRFLNRFFQELTNGFLKYTK